jgi:hypothetical protein
MRPTPPPSDPFIFIHGEEYLDSLGFNHPSMGPDFLAVNSLSLKRLIDTSYHDHNSRKLHPAFFVSLLHFGTQEVEDKGWIRQFCSIPWDYPLFLSLLQI